MIIFARAIRHLELDREQAFADAIHNPYRTSADAPKLFNQLQAERISLITGREDEDRARGSGPGISMDQLQRAFGPIKRQEVTREQIEAMKRPRGPRQ
jgi:hypothetical protein